MLDVLLGVVAAAAYAFGAIGMMSMSWQAVTQRVREIAIRRAIGARREEVLAQFVVEGVLCASAGAFVGVLVGMLSSATAAVAAGWPLTLSAGRVATAMASAIAIALLSTLYPARRAATLDPVAALRFDR